MGGLTVDGVNDDYDDSYCRWDMMQGATGTYLRSIQVNHNLLNSDSEPEEDFMHW